MGEETRLCHRYPIENRHNRDTSDFAAPALSTWKAAESKRPTPADKLQLSPEGIDLEKENLCLRSIDPGPENDTLLAS
jgi:hypothetical protein